MRRAASRPCLRPARGEILLTRMLLLIAILLAMLVVPIYLWKEQDNKAKKIDAAERAAVPVPPAGPAPADAVDPDRLGLTFGWGAPADGRRLMASCTGMPGAQASGPVHGDCKPMSGDTSCRTQLAVLCLREGSGAWPELATAGQVAGFALASEAQGNALCADALGAGWRMARYEDSRGGYIDGERPTGANADTARRAWVATRLSPSNCWDAR